MQAWPPPYLLHFKRADLLEYAAKGPQQSIEAGLELLRRELKKEEKRARKRDASDPPDD
jgi:hypothetical protein